MSKPNDTRAPGAPPGPPQANDKQYHLAQTEARFAQLIWDNEPITSGELVRLCQQQLGWKATTTYTVLRRLCDRGLFCNQNSTVRALVSREEFDRQRSRAFVQETFDGSLPGFLAAFMGGRRLTARQADEIQHLIDSYREEE